MELIALTLAAGLVYVLVHVGRTANSHQEMLEERTRALVLTRRVAEAANRCVVTDDALQLALREVCEYTGWDIGHSWTVKHGLMTPADRWTTVDGPVPPPLHGSPAPDGGELAQVVATAEPVWKHDGEVPAAVAELDMRGWLVFPVVVGARVVGVMEFLTREPVVPSALDLDLMSQIGVQLGLSFQRQAALKRFARRTQELTEANRSLAKANSQLEDFAHVASHDLKAPLRAIRSLAKWIGEDLPDDVPEHVREHCELMDGRVRRLERLLDDLLKYASSGVSGDAEVVSCEALIQQVVDMVQFPEAFDVRISKTDLQISTVSTPLEHVLLNLISNARQHSHEDRGTVQIAVTELNPEWVEFTVSDNGPGIEPRHRDQVWEIFRTLAPRDTKDTSGVGLAIVKKTVEAVGGQVVVTDSELGGVTFGFTWPRFWQGATAMRGAA